VLIHTRCPLDDTDDADVEVYPANFQLEQLDPSIFSARRLPDRIHYRMVRNTRTGCLRADPVLDDDTLLALYRASKVTYEPVTEFTATTYLHYFRRVLPQLSDRRGILEIGCGNGFFLDQLTPFAFERVCGVEPSEEAVAKAAPSVRPGIVPGVLQVDTFPPDSFSLVCGFQVLDHLARPNEVLQLCKRVLAPGGVTLWICHDIGAWTARLLGRACPMIDIEHTVLYDRLTIRQLFERNGFEVLEVGGVRNGYPLGYWSRLAPLPRQLKSVALRFLAATGLGRWNLSMNLGNMYLTARKGL
jgi:SAM-dependent methyltransferase